MGIDVFLDWTADSRDPEALGKALEAIDAPAFHLHMITNRGVKVYTRGLPGTFCTDHWRCRFISVKGRVDFNQILVLLQKINAAGLEVIKTEHLYDFDGEPGYSSGQGE